MAHESDRLLATPTTRPTLAREIRHGEDVTVQVHTRRRTRRCGQRFFPPRRVPPPPCGPWVRPCCRWPCPWPFDALVRWPCPTDRGRTHGPALALPCGLATATAAARTGPAARSVGWRIVNSGMRAQAVAALWPWQRRANQRSPDRAFVHSVARSVSRRGVRLGRGSGAGRSIP